MQTLFVEMDICTALGYFVDWNIKINQATKHNGMTTFKPKLNDNYNTTMHTAET